MLPKLICHAIVAILSIPHSSYYGEEYRGAAIPEGGVALPEIFVTGDVVAYALKFCALSGDDYGEHIVA